MSNQAMTWALKQNIQPTGAKFVFVMLANYANGDGYCYAGQGRIAADTGQSERSVRGHLADLEAAGWIVRERRNHKSGQRAVDGFHLVGFHENQPATFAASQPAELASSQPENTAGSDAEPTGNFRQTNRQLSPPLIRKEPTIEPTIRAHRSSERVRPAPKPNRCDPIWDALVSLLGRSPETPSERGAWNKAVAELKAAKATPEQIAERGERYRHEWPRVKLTASALARHWSEFADAPAAEYQPPVWNGWTD